MELQDKVALVTGASRGIGRAIALTLAEAGMSVLLAAKDLGMLEALADEIRGAGGRAEAVRCDLLVPEEREALAREPEQRFGRLDLLVNNAGGTPSRQVLETPPGELEWILSLNLMSVMQLTRDCLPLLLRASGTIVNISSVAGLYGSPGLSAYAAAKAGLITWTESLWEEVRRSGVRVCAVCPGRVDNGRQWDEHGMTPEDVAGAVRFIAASSPRVCPIRIHLREQRDPGWLD